MKPQSVFDDDDFYTIDQLKTSLRDLEGYQFIYLDKHEGLIFELARCKGKIDYLFNLCDEGYWNNARMELHVPALCDLLGIPYTGAGPQALAHCYDKSLVRGVAKEMGLPVADAFFIHPEDVVFDVPFGFPAMVKPNFGDSSFGITQQSVVHNLEELLNAISDVREKLGYDKPILVEEFLPGKEFSVGIIGNFPKEYLVLPITEEDYSDLPAGLPQICGYEAKWDPSSPYWKLKSVLAGLPEETEKYVVECSLKLFERLECRDYARFDWRLDVDGKPKILEVNPNPGWCWDGHMAKMAKFAEMPYREMLKTILQTAEQRMGIVQVELRADKDLERPAEALVT